MSEKRSKIDKDSKLKAQVDKDLIVHNMPLISKSKDSTVKRSAKSLGFKVSNISRKRKFKTLGLFIIIGGLIFISILVYLSYLFIIKPAVQPGINSISTQNSKDLKTKTETKDISNKKKVLNSEDLSPLASSSLINTKSSSTILNLASTTEIVNTSDNPQASSTIQKEINNLPPLLDSDHDGLNNLEELVLGTSPNSSDTNNNGYSDLVEVNNNYNPIGTGRLEADQKLTNYYNQVYAYRLLYSKDFLLSSVNNGETIFFTAPNSSLIQVSSQENSQRENILDWYQKLFPKIVINSDQVKTTKTWAGIMGQDGLNFYLTDKQKTNIFIISYIPALSERIVYPNVFKLMINSMVLE